MQMHDAHPGHHTPATVQRPPKQGRLTSLIDLRARSSLSDGPLRPLYLRAKPYTASDKAKGAPCGDAPGGSDSDMYRKQRNKVTQTDKELRFESVLLQRKN